MRILAVKWSDLFRAHGKNHVEDKQEPEKDRSDFVVKLMAESVLIQNTPREDSFAS